MLEVRAKRLKDTEKRREEEIKKWLNDIANEAELKETRRKSRGGKNTTRRRRGCCP